MPFLKRKFLLGLVVLILLGGTACSQVFPTAQTSELPDQPTPTEQTVAETETEPIAVMEEEVPVDIVEEPANPPTDIVTEDQTEEPTVAPPVEATEEPASDEPAGLGDPALHATDPSTVSLASGKVQLVEFFAFW